MTKMLYPNGLLVVDQSFNPIKSATLTPYLPTDADRANPLPVYDAQTGEAITLKSNSNALLPSFWVDVPDGQESQLLVFRSGTRETTLWSPQALLILAQNAMAAAQASAVAAAGSQSAAEQAEENATGVSATQIDNHLGGDATNLVQTVAGKADLDPATGKVEQSQLPDTANIPAASPTQQGTVRLAGDLGGTANSPTVPGLAAIAGKAANSAVVHNSGAETVNGVKTFTSPPVVPDGSWSIADTDGLQQAIDDAANSGGGGGTPSWDSLTDKPAVIAAGATKANARDAIGAGTSNLKIGTSSTQAKAGDWTPAISDVSGLQSALDDKIESDALVPILDVVTEGSLTGTDPSGVYLIKES